MHVEPRLSAILTVSQTVAAAVHYPTIFHATLFVGHYFLTPVLFYAFVVLLGVILMVSSTR